MGTKIIYFKLRVTGFLNITIHVNFIIERLVMLDNETFESCVFVAVQLTKEILDRSHLFHFIN